MALLAVLGAAAYGGFALAKNDSPATPSITAKPTNPTASTSASFSFTDSTSGVTFKCSLDAAAYAACTSPKPYTGLTAGSHTFAVQAVSGSNTSSAASYTWVIDTTAPTASISFPANAATYSAAGYGAGCSPAGICGTAADPSGVASVRVSIKRNSTGKYWNGSGFTLASETFNTASGTTSWKYGLVVPPDDSYTVHVQATDSIANAQSGVTYAASSSFTIDTLAPPVPSINSGPTGLVNAASASFGFTDTEVGVSFLCKLDSAAFVACTSPANYSGLAQGAHSFQVEAKDSAGNISDAASRSWTVDTIAPAAPTITSKPAPATNQSTATFAFTSEASATFLCKLDGAATFTACSSGISYPGLAVGSHTFSVEAKDSAGNIGPAATYTWTIDTTPPSITVNFPTNGGIYNAASWNGGCSGGAALCGSATDPHGVSSGVVSILQVSSGKYWNGSNFASASEVFNAAQLTAMSGTTYSGRYPLALPPDGQYTVHVRATDGAGNTTPAGLQVTLSFKIDTVKPPAPIFDSTPPNPNSTATSTFVWHDTAVDVDHYLCSVENGSFQTTVPSLGGPTQPCSSALTYNVQTTNNGQHQFAVEAVDAAGNVSQSISYSWKVAAGTPAQFVIHGSVAGLAPGLTKPVPLTIDNPNSVAIFITQLTFAVSANASSGTCLALSYTVTPWNSNPPTTPDLQVPANASGFVVPLANQPSIKLINSAANQDNCKGKSFTLTFSGSAHS